MTHADERTLLATSAPAGVGCKSTYSSLSCSGFSFTLGESQYALGPVSRGERLLSR